MKANPSSPGARPRRLAASLLLSLLPLTGQTLGNGNFDAQTFGGCLGYASGNGGVINVASAMIVNDTDADGDALTLATFAATSFNNGTVTETAGVITYTPAANFSGLDGFTYTVSDGWGGTSVTATVVINVTEVAEVPPGQLVLNIDLVGGSVTGTFAGTPGATYILQRSTTLVGLWDNVDTEVAPISGIVEVKDLSPPPLRAFYRISYTP